MSKLLIFFITLMHTILATRIILCDYFSDMDQHFVTCIEIWFMIEHYGVIWSMYLTPLIRISRGGCCSFEDFFFLMVSSNFCVIMFLLGFW